MKFITLTSAVDGVKVHLNVVHIGHVTSVEGKYTDEKYTNVGSTTHNNGGFRVKETVEEVMQLILN